MKTNVRPAKLVYFLTIIDLIVMVSDYKVICNEIGLILSFVIIIVMLIDNEFKIKVKNREKKLLLAIVFFSLYYLITCMFNGQAKNYIISFAYYIIEFTLVFVFLYFNEKSEYYYEEQIIKWFFITWNVFCAISLFYYFQIPDLARQMAANRSAYTHLIIGGGYPMAYGSVVLAVFLFQQIIESKFISRKLRFFAIGEIVFLAVLIIYTNSFICLLALFLGFAFCVCGRFLKGQTLIGTIILILIIGIIIYINLTTILQTLLTYNNNEFIEKRLSELYDLTANDVTSFHLAKRSSLYQMSIESFFKSPILGVGYKFGNTVSLLQENGIGSHSTLLDTLGQFGLLGAIPLYSVLYYPVKKTAELKVKPFYLISFFIILALNPSFTTFHFVLVTYLIIPLICRSRFIKKA